MIENSTFRQELEKLRVVDSDEPDQEEVSEVRQATEEFVDKIKSDAGDAPTVADTIPKEAK